MDRLQRIFGSAAGNMGSQMQPGMDTPTVDNAEMVHISSLALLKMLKHGRAGVPMEVMGLMLGDFVDDYTVRVIDVFAMPQSGTGVSVEAVDPVFQTKMSDMLKQTGRPEVVVGWYHSHPGFGCWLSSVDINTQQSFEQLNQRAVAVVVDPIQSVKGKVVIDAFRLINPQVLMLGQEPRQTTSNIGHLNKPSIQALIHGLNRHYYSIAINYRKNELEEKMLLNLHKKNWTHGLTLTNFSEHTEMNEKSVEAMLKLAEAYNKSVQEESTMTAEQLKTRHVGKQDPKRHLEDRVEEVMSNNIVMALGTMIDSELDKELKGYLEQVQPDYDPRSTPTSISSDDVQRMRSSVQESQAGEPRLTKRAEYDMHQTSLGPGFTTSSTTSNKGSSSSTTSSSSTSTYTPPRPPAPDAKSFEEGGRALVNQKQAIHDTAMDNCADLHYELLTCFKEGSFWEKATMCQKQRRKFWNCFMQQKG
ncbi:26S proteasome non-ATPase regulatory subunit 14 [Bifiguratus adelaidae]|uniref:26S proteasome non-ATPase regulatory subunit 14 n=1 Tax=Bifiguratus adelaidae TaxID=1938954 RepID=A0A261Y6Z3_9FUNG|nr:26S proteasome non-ATPase regulatory subunit 14 [Bifiguratus adelaidae]